MFRDIVVPVDGTGLAERAIPWALAALAPNGTLHLTHAHVFPTPMLVEGVVVSDPAFDTNLRAQETDYLTKLADRVRNTLLGCRVQMRNIDSDSPAAVALAEATGQIGADLVVMTAHNRGPFARFLLGSFADELLRVSTVPVMTLRVEGRDEDVPDLSEKAQLNRLIVPLDGSELAERIVDSAVRFATALKARITLLLVLDAIDDAGAIGRMTRAELSEIAHHATLEERASAYLDLVAKTIASAGGTAETKLVHHGSAAKVILDAANGDPHTGVALATHGRSGVTRLLRGSVADEVIHNAVGPVLAFHPSA
jgi:nucleotide-binding universal stress UspA family protein